MTKITKITNILIPLLLASTQTLAFHLSAQVYHQNNTIETGTPLYVTRFGYLTSEIGDADEFNVNHKQQLVTFPGKARSQPVGIFNTTLSKKGLAPLTSLNVGNEVKITTDFDIYKHEADDKEEEYEIIAFENDAFQYGEAVFLAQKPYKGSNETKELEGQQIFVLGDSQFLDSDYWRLVDLVIVRGEQAREEI